MARCARRSPRTDTPRARPATVVCDPALAASQPDDALAGSAFVVTQLRVGGQEARHRDELTGREFGLIGQERAEMFDGAVRDGNHVGWRFK